MISLRAAVALALLLVLVSSFGACALTAPPADATLSSASAMPQSVAAAASGELDALAMRAIEAARTDPTAVELQIEAAARLFQAADLRLQTGIVDWLALHPDASRGAVLSAESQLDEGRRREILSLCTTGLEFAELAAAAAPQDVRVSLYQGLHLSLVAWANGPARSLMAGYGTRLVAAIDRALAIDPGFDHGAPLRLQGRFRSKAPWPYGDLPAAKLALAQAVELASIPVNHLFLGDALAASGDPAGAEAQWRATGQAEADESTRWSAELFRELARRRLAAKP